MTHFQRNASVAAVSILLGGLFFVNHAAQLPQTAPGQAQDQIKTQVQSQVKTGPVEVHSAMRFDVSAPLSSLHASNYKPEHPDCKGAECGMSPDDPDAPQLIEAPPPTIPVITAAGAAVEQTSHGQGPGVPLLESFDGLGAGFKGPNGTEKFGSPSDDSLAVGPNHIVQIVNTHIAVYTKKGARYDQTGKVLYGPAPTYSIFSGFGGVCQARNNGDGVVRYDQLAGRWLIIMPIMTRTNPDEFPTGQGEAVRAGQASTPGAAATLPATPPPNSPDFPGYLFSTAEAKTKPNGTFTMCYAVSTSDDPLGTYYRYAFARKLFPDYPRPAVWPDGYYLPTSTGDEVIQKHTCIADRRKMLKGEPATEQCLVIDGVNFLNNADVDGYRPPPPGEPNIMMADGGAQLKKIFDDDGIFVWKVHVDWDNPANTHLTGPVKIPVAPYHFLCDGELSRCVPQPGTEMRLDSQGDKLMQRLVYRRVGNHESIVAVHSIATKAGGGGVRWYEFRLDKKRAAYLYQQGTYAPDQYYRWMPSIAMDKKGDIGVGYSFGGTPNFVGQRFAARRPTDPKGVLTLHETVLASGAAAQTDTLRWEDYTTTAIDPSDDCTFWYLGDYLKTGDTGYRSRIGSFRLPECKGPAKMK